MHIPIQTTSRAHIENLIELRINLRNGRGAVIEYSRVFSLILYSEITPRFEWVDEHQSRLRAGLRHTLFTLLLGWWSPMGVLPSMAAIVNNLRGGVEVTALIRNEGGDEDALRIELERMAEDRRKGRAVQDGIMRVFGYGLILVLLISAAKTC
jgi:hypothetical protein